ncbi:MAG: FtsX-like permease family protein, partial [Acidobacteriaceae bacterium]
PALHFVRPDLAGALRQSTGTASKSTQHFRKAAVGLYGVLAYATQSRTREIGVRLAVGAPRSSLVRLVLLEMAWIAAGATVLALPATVGLAHFFRSQLYGVSTTDPVTLLYAVGLTAAMVVLAAAVPAQRAASVDPMRALRNE